ncbi:sulfite exporter TauE/SafE family protein [Candidatus Dojkabacteria bacterium]|uniref:Sulfite exporter TauE/SafE family protein n=1 Tax=Candidatus Dojkabacteria bacterium TaxID=2099670 RepID=A0A955LA15_9BACT|nr:sulfite exporter TauE/SafE family protein [Candidatus Dojkabacteria bacterium]
MSKKKKRKSQDSTEIKQCTLYVDGMHCSACEVLIEKKLLKKDGIESVDASLRDSRVKVSYTGDNRPNPKDVTKELKELGYEFSDSKFKKDTTPIFRFVNGQLRVNPIKFKSMMKNLLVVFGLVVAFFVFEKLQLGGKFSVDSGSSLPAFFVLGIVAGLSSCAALVGGLLLSMIKQWNELYIGESQKQKSEPHILFHVGRLVSFALLGGVLGLIGDAISLDNATVYSILVFVVSIVMFVLAMQMLGVEWAQKFRFTAPKSVGTYVADERNFKGRYMPGILGALTFFLPCGFTLMAQGIALTSGSMISGALIMLMFALGTLPTLVAISFSGLTFNKKPHMTAKFNYIAGLVIVFFVIYNINGQLNVLGYPSLSDIKFSLPESNEQVQVVDTNNQVGDVQVLNFEASGFSYTAKGSTTLKAGQPAKLVVDNKGVQGCGAFIAARGLIDGFVELKRGINEIDLGVVQAGSYKLTCSMGMVSPVTITVK